MLSPELNAFLEALAKVLIAAGGMVGVVFGVVKTWQEVAKARQAFSHLQIERTVSTLEKRATDAESRADRAEKDFKTLSERVDVQQTTITDLKLKLQDSENDRETGAEKNAELQRQITVIQQRAAGLADNLQSAQKQLIDVQGITISNQNTIIDLQQQHQKDAEQQQRDTLRITELLGLLEASENEKKTLLQKLATAEDSNRQLLIEQIQDRQRISDLERKEGELRAEIETLKHTANLSDAAPEPGGGSVAA